MDVSTIQMFYFSCARLRDINDDTVALKCMLLNKAKSGRVLVHAGFICADHGRFSCVVMIEHNEMPFYFS